MLFHNGLIQTTNINKESETMKLIRVFIAAIFLSAFLTIAASAQTQPKPQTTPQPAPQATPQQTQTTPARPAPVPVAFIYSPWFVDEKQGGIKRFIAAITTINNEFRSSGQELETLNNRINTLTNEINASQGNEPGLAAKVEELDKLKRDFEYKQKSGKAALDKRQREILLPVEEHMYAELRNYVKQFGIKVVIDVAKIQDAVVFYSVEADITKAFIADYNARFPVGTPPPTTTPVKQP